MEEEQVSYRADGFRHSPFRRRDFLQFVKNKLEKRYEAGFFLFLLAGPK
jgi:hypothetical protein